ncbi:hypothetical protein J6590_002579 [Homalodisca vitripennis]|nr:hypothetical protein J6590_002579 [Homalodisca vitripennis]
MLPLMPPTLLTFLYARSISEEFSSGDTRYRDNEETVSSHGKERKDKEDRDEEMIKVYDGNNSLRRRIFRVVTVSRLANTDHILLTALRAFHITKDPQNFYLTDLYSPEESTLSDPCPVMNLHRREGKRPAVFLRFKKMIRKFRDCEATVLANFLIHFVHQVITDERWPTTPVFIVNFEECALFKSMSMVYSLGTAVHGSVRSA